eukprot:6242-Heterococcus_DN1.PRE.5
MHGCAITSVPQVLCIIASSYYQHYCSVSALTLRIIHSKQTQVVERMRGKLGINLRCVDASDRFLALLQGKSDPEEKRKLIGSTFIDIFQEEALSIGQVDFLLQGTLYPDVIESISYKGPSAVIKSHHNVGGLPATMHLKLIEPLRELFKAGMCAHTIVCKAVAYRRQQCDSACTALLRTPSDSLSTRYNDDACTPTVLLVIESFSCSKRCATPPLYHSLPDLTQ